MKMIRLGSKVVKNTSTQRTLFSWKKINLESMHNLECFHWQDRMQVSSSRLESRNTRWMQRSNIRSYSQQQTGTEKEQGGNAGKVAMAMAMVVMGGYFLMSKREEQMPPQDEIKQSTEVFKVSTKEMKEDYSKVLVSKRLTIINDPRRIVSRKQEKEIAESFRSKSDRLHIITGENGVGKTTLARAILRFQDGVIDLSSSKKQVSDVEAMILHKVTGKEFMRPKEIVEDIKDDVNPRILVEDIFRLAISEQKKKGIEFRPTILIKLDGKNADEEYFSKCYNVLKHFVSKGLANGIIISDEIVTKKLPIHKDDVLHRVHGLTEEEANELFNQRKELVQDEESRQKLYQISNRPQILQDFIDEQYRNVDEFVQYLKTSKSNQIRDCVSDSPSYYKLFTELKAKKTISSEKAHKIVPRENLEKSIYQYHLIAYDGEHDQYHFENPIIGSLV